MSTIEPIANDQRGEFWLPATPETRIAGKLQFGPPLAGQLVLDGELMPGPGPEPLVHGLLFSGQHITAFICCPQVETQGSHGIASSSAQKLAVRTLIIGEDIDEHAKFDHLLIRLSHIREWANVRQGWDFPEGPGPDYAIPYEAPPVRTAALKDGRTVTLRTVDDLTTSSGAIHGDQQTEFLVSFPKSVPLEAVMETVASVRDLMTFAARRPASVTSLAVTCPGVLVGRMECQ